jgi:hypothetical protein
VHLGQLARVATLELEASGCLTVEVDWKKVAGGRTSTTRNHHTLTPAWEPWGSPHGHCTVADSRNATERSFDGYLKTAEVYSGKNRQPI